MSKITPKQAKNILAANLSNLSKKVAKGKVLSGKEFNLVQSVAIDGTTAVSQEFAKNKVELAAALGVNRRTINNWVKIPGNPGTRPNGRYCVSEWREFKQKHGRFGDDQADEFDQPQLRAKNLLLQNQKLGIQVAALRNEFVPFSDVERWGADLGAAIRKVVTQIHLIAPNLSGITVPEIEERLKESEQEILQQLHTLGEKIDDWKSKIGVTESKNEPAP